MGNSINVEPESNSTVPCARSEIPTTNKKFDDPRSPSKEVSRTPLKIENLQDDQQSIDPRSPSGINRTPIQISNSATHKETDGVRMVLRYENRPST